MKFERWFWLNRFKPILERTPGIKYDRIESVISPSIPDLAISGETGHGWIEMKVAKNTKNSFKLPTMSKGQVVWIRDRGVICGMVYIIAWDKNMDHIWLFDHQHGDELRDGVAWDKIKEYSIFHESGLNRNAWSTTLSKIFNRNIDKTPLHML